MLKEIYCELLQIPSRPSGKIKFHNGLNVVLGSTEGATSIGKSTALLIIDFVFGGDTYAKSDAVRELGNHEIFFTFEFNGKLYFYSRSTATPDYINIVDDKRNLISTLSKTEFIDFLKNEYDLNFEGLQFRNTLSRFFRIYGKDNYNELKPLQTRGGNEAQKSAIKVLVALFNRYSEILAFEEQLKLAEDRIKAFRDARKYEFIPSAVDGIKKYEKNLASIAELQNKKEELQSLDNSSFSTTDVEQANELNNLKLQLGIARRLLQNKKNDLELIKLNISQGIYPTEADFQSLLEFFPEANIKKLMEIERFHNKIQSILTEEFEMARTEAREEVKVLQQAVDDIQNKIEKIKPSMAFTQEFLDAYTEIDRKIHTLEDENDAFNTRNNLQKEKKQANDRLNSHMSIILQDIMEKIQHQLISISDYVSENIENYPVLQIHSPDGYQFLTPRNTGTGTNYKGMFFYDLSVLQSTNLPAIAHDSLLFPYISDKHICRLLHLYAREKNKQIFIAFDHDENYGKETNELLKEHTVLKLDQEDQALFGKQWGRKDSPKNENSIQ